VAQPTTTDDTGFAGAGDGNVDFSTSKPEVPLPAGCVAVCCRLVKPFLEEPVFGSSAAPG
jgi:hypothetical protein